ncbi:MAG: 8-amino-7-oxononanoate synthase [Nitrospina sp.]|nr:8-amino-7-oxononanoate synthase [Nitrospina sp.]MBT3875892.1 8-amino-7-oxononanoate synthase [Nitrospina sp.]MBT4046973.1 8-amino-7-oxononanoate synthase [Nitrospina sp.]MBT4557307.1 8-amino-7-oxononanoate synthase [Nitrospina sp.]MBT5347579.1 8-amino-7-oxononanoate synthase [Nitrospina sp.]
MSEQFFKRLEKELSTSRENNLYREVKNFPECKVNLCANDYFQLRHDPRVIEGAKTACEKYGTGSGASPLLSGFLPCHQSLLDQLCIWKHKTHGMLFNSGFMGNQAVLKHLPGKNDIVLADKLIHHSIAQALLQGSARFKRYHHLDLEHLQELLETHHKEYETVFVVTESVFSMDGDYPDLKKLTALKKDYPFILILDEAHGTGVFGETGGGLAEEMQVQDQVDILIGTLGKSLASMGAYVLTDSSTIIDFLVNRAGEFIYSTFLSPAQVGAAEAALKILRVAKEERRYLQEISGSFRRILKIKEREKILYPSPIVPVIIGDPVKTIELRNTLLQHGILVGAIRPPTVQPHTSRLRISLHTGVKQETLEMLGDLLLQWIKS